MNKIEKAIIAVICKEFSNKNGSLDIEEVLLSFDIPKIRFNLIGITPEQITEVLKKFEADEYLLGSEQTDSGWAVSLNFSKLPEFYNLSILGNKLTHDQATARRRFENSISNAQKAFRINESYSKLRKEFAEGKWLRLCCASCGDFICEIHSFDELKGLEEKEIECLRKKHKNQVKLKGNNVIFSSVDTDIFELLKDKRN